MKLEGSIKGPWVGELNKAWMESMEKLEKRALVLDLGGVRFADRAGRELLVNIRRAGTELAGASGFIRHLLDSNGAGGPENIDSSEGEQ